VVWNNSLTEIIGVLDWEMATVGDPLMDLGAALAWWSEPSDGDFSKMMNLTWLNGTLTRQQAADRYADKTGRDLSDILFYYVFGLYKNAVIGQQIYARWKKGLTKDDRFSGLIYGVFELSKMAMRAIESGKI
jgi:aminoglycoside phosphotransferase (APT) family kinase protein